MSDLLVEEIQASCGYVDQVPVCKSCNFCITVSPSCVSNEINYVCSRLEEEGFEVSPEGCCRLWTRKKDGDDFQGLVGFTLKRVSEEDEEGGHY